MLDTLRKRTSFEEDEAREPWKSPVPYTQRLVVYNRPETLAYRTRQLNEAGPSLQSAGSLNREKPWDYPRQRPLWSYCDNEWVEDREVPRFINHLYKSALTYDSGLCLNNLVYGVNPDVDNNQSSEAVDEIFSCLREIPNERPFKVVDIDKQPLLIYLPNILSTVWKNAPHSDIHNSDKLDEIVRNALDSLAADFPPSNKASETRYSHQADEKEKYPTYGTYHFAVWRGAGHHHDTHVFHHQDSVGPRGKQMSASTVFLDTISPLIQSIGIIFEGVDKDSYKSYLRIFDSYQDKAPMRYLQTSRRACFMVIAVLRNNRVHPHKDKGDYRDGWAVMTCFGDFEGGDLCLPSLDVDFWYGERSGVRIGYKPGDVVFLRSSVVEHFISRFTGERRSSFVFCTKAQS